MSTEEDPVEEARNILEPAHERKTIVRDQLRNLVKSMRDNKIPKHHIVATVRAVNEGLYEIWGDACFEAGVRCGYEAMREAVRRMEKAARQR